MNKVAVISVSGGMDSTGLLVHLLKNRFDVKAISFYYGQKHKVQLQRIEKNIEYLKSKNFNIQWNKVDLSDAMGIFRSALISKDIDVPQGHYQQENMKLTVVPNRNAIFSSIIYGYALSLISRLELEEINICLGVHSGDHAIYKDCTPMFYDKIYQAFKQGNWDGDKVRYYLPYINDNKTIILQDALENCASLQLDFNTIFSNTITCYNPDVYGRSCGKCGSCTQRLQAFNELKLLDPVQYVN